MIIDTHAHLNFKPFRKDWEQVIERAFEAGVGAIVNVGSNLANSQRAVEIAERFEHGVYAAVGLHPIEVDNEVFAREIFFDLGLHPKVVAIGETGLDYFHRSSKAKQEEVLKQSIDLANACQKPVILHSRNSDSKLLDLLSREEYRVQKDPPGVLHCFGRGLETARRFLDLGFYLSFTGNITYTLAPAIVEMIRKIPVGRIMGETDCPYLAPQTRRGKRNEPAFVVEVLQRVAEIKETPFSDIVSSTAANARRVFGIGGTRT